MITNAAILKDGVIYQDRRHHLIIKANPPMFFLLATQGFVTDKGEFLNRRQAAEYAIKCGQIHELKFNKHKLFSEDLW